MKEVAGGTKNLCPSCKTNKLLSGERKKFNARSKVTGKLICGECSLDEAIQSITGV